MSEAVWISLGAFVVAAVALAREEQIRRAIRNSRPGERLRQPITAIRDGLEEAAASSQSWINNKQEIGKARKHVESELPALKDSVLLSRLQDMNCIQAAFETGANLKMSEYAIVENSDELREVCLRGEAAAKDALHRIAQLDAKV